MFKFDSVTTGQYTFMLAFCVLLKFSNILQFKTKLRNTCTKTKSTSRTICLCYVKVQ